jgi:hypothetical protein
MRALLFGTSHYKIIARDKITDRSPLVTKQTQAENRSLPTRNLDPFCTGFGVRRFLKKQLQLIDNPMTVSGKYTLMVFRTDKANSMAKWDFDVNWVNGQSKVTYLFRRFIVDRKYS